MRSLRSSVGRRRSGQVPDDRELLATGSIFDQDWYELEAGCSFATRADAIAHYVEEGSHVGLSPHPFFSPIVVRAKERRGTPLGHYLRSASQSSSHPAWDMSSYIDRTPEASIHPLGPLGHLADNLTPNTLVDVRAAGGTRLLPWAEVSAGWADVAREWAYQQRLRILAFTDIRPDPAPVWAHPRPAESEETFVSIIVPTWNRADSIAIALESIVRQGWQHWEAIVVDDGSTDDTVEVVTKLAEQEPRIRVIERSHKGVAAARNAGIEAARGTLIAFLDSDNTWEPDFLDAMVRVMAHERAQAAYATLEIPGSSGSRYRANDVDFEILAASNHVDMNVLVVAKALVDEIGGFDARVRRAVDYDLVLAIAARTDIVHVPVVGAVYDDSDAKDRISNSQPRSWNFWVQAKHSIAWDELASVERCTDLTSVVIVMPTVDQRAMDVVHGVSRLLPREGFEFVLVDNSPTRDGSAALTGVLASDQRARYVRLPGRIPYALSADIGFKASAGDVVVFLAAGAMPGEGAVEALATAVRSSARPVVAQVPTVTEEGVVLSAGGAFGWEALLPMPFLKGHEFSAIAVAHPVEIPVLDGHTFAVRAVDFAEMHGLDPLFENELETADFSLRLKQRHADALTLLLPTRPVVVGDQPWDPTYSEASRSLFIGRHGSSVRPTSPTLWRQFDRMLSGWVPIYAQRHAFFEVTWPV